MVALNDYSQERLARLLRLLRPAPQASLERAQRTVLEMLTQDSSEGEGRGLTEAEVMDLARALELDPLFRKWFDEDPVAAVEAAGWPTLARNIEREVAQLLALVEQITTDSSYRAELLEDPLARLEKSGMPALAGEQLLQALEIAADVGTLLPEVVAHGQDDGSARSRLLILLVGSAAVGAMLRGIPGDTT